MIIPVCATFKNRVYTASLSYRAPFPLDFWGIYFIGILVQCSLHENSDDKCTHTPSARRCPREAKLSRRAELRRWILSDLLFYEYWLHHGITEASFVLLMICTIFLAMAEQASFLCLSGLTKTFRCFRASPPAFCFQRNI
jgi:hypothetical protein